MKILERSVEASQWCEAYRKASLSLGFVPTLGGLHEGHLSLVRQARLECDRVLVSIYLNPSQFDSAEDLEEYPADLEADLDACRQAGVDIVLLGEQAEFLPEGFQSWVFVEKLTEGLCGAGRPGHFRGVSTVVTHLFHVVKPWRAYFDLKDFQQAKVISRMVADLFFDVDLHLLPTVRSDDGLAVSSRNKRLTAAERKQAVAIGESLQGARELLAGGETSVAGLKEHMTRLLEKAAGCKVEYVEVLSAASLEEFPDGEVSASPEGVLLAVAAWFGEVRLIDNILFSPACPLDEVDLETQGGS